MVRDALDWAAECTGVLRRLERRMCDGLTILTYHRVLPDEQAYAYPHPALAMPASVFARQVEWLSRRYRVVLLRDAMREVPFNGRPTVCLTFDDGYADNYDTVAPVLEKYSVRGVFFVTVGAIAVGQPLWFDVAAARWEAHRADGAGSLAEWLESLKRLSPAERSGRLANMAPGRADGDVRLMTSQQVTDLHARGHEIGSHSLTHALLPQLDDAELARELSESKKLIESWTGGQVRGICYPNGDADSRVIAAARAAGYSCGCTTAPGRNDTGTDPMLLHRIDITAPRVAPRRSGFRRRAFRAEVTLFHERFR